MVRLPDTEQSFWRDAYIGESIYPELRKDLEVDIAIVGAGITGLTAAYLLKQSGHTVAVLEKDTIGAGTTGRTTGKVTSQHGLNYLDLHNRLGKETARVYAEANQAAVEQIGRIIEKERISCDWQWDDNYIFTEDVKKVEQLKQEAKVAADLGLPATFETKLPLPFPVKGAIRFTDQGKFHSQKYLLGLAQSVSGNGSHVFENSRVISIKDGNRSRIRTRKAVVNARHIIVASHVPTFPLIARFGYALLEYPTESFAIAAQLKGRLSGMYMSPDKEHYSIQPIDVDGKSVLLIVGAGGNIPGFSGNKEARYQQLANYARKRFAIRSVTHRWADMDYLAYDEIPLIGKLYPWSTRVYVGTGFKKWGLTNGTVAGMILSDLIGGKDNDWASAFNSIRLKPITSFPRAVTQFLKGRG